eukprot:785615-Prorocentrum_minimum.AAC.3
MFPRAAVRVAYTQSASAHLANVPFSRPGAYNEGRTARLHVAASAVTDAPVRTETRPSVRGQVAKLFAEAIEKVFPGQVRRDVMDFA